MRGGTERYLREGGRAQSQGRERHRTRKALVVVQVALALVLLICSGLMIRTFGALMHVSPGFMRSEQLADISLCIPEAQIPDAQGERVVHMQQDILDKLAAMPGVSSVSFSSAFPWMETTPTICCLRRTTSIERANFRRYADFNSSRRDSSQRWARGW